MSSIAQDHEIITERELARLEAAGWINTSLGGRGLWIGAGWMVLLRRYVAEEDGAGVFEERVVVVAVDEELDDSRVISGDDVDGAHSGTPAYHPPTTQPQRNAGTPAPEPIPARLLWHTALLAVAVWACVLGVCMLIGWSMIGGLL